jgi:hypothetical protein
VIFGSATSSTVGVSWNLCIRTAFIVGAVPFPIFLFGTARGQVVQPSG